MLGLCVESKMVYHHLLMRAPAANERLIPVVKTRGRFIDEQYFCILRQSTAINTAAALPPKGAKSSCRIDCYPQTLQRGVAASKSRAFGTDIIATLCVGPKSTISSTE